MLQPPILRHFERVDLRREISGGAAPLIIQSAVTGIRSDPNEEIEAAMTEGAEVSGQKPGLTDAPCIERCEQDADRCHV